MLCDLIIYIEEVPEKMFSIPSAKENIIIRSEQEKVYLICFDGHHCIDITALHKKLNFRNIKKKLF